MELRVHRTISAPADRSWSSMPDLRPPLEKFGDGIKSHCERG